VPIAPSTVYDNLVDAGQFAIAQEGQQLYKLNPDFPTTLGAWIQALYDFTNNPSLGLAPGEKTILLKRLLHLFSMCPERREAEYEGITWYDYHNPAPTTQSAQYNKMFVTGFSRAFVAMDAQKASTMTGANTLSQFFRVFFEKGTMDRVLNAPTNDAWINPWVAYLKHIGVTFHQNETLTKLNVSAGTSPKKITSATVYNNATDAVTQVAADYYIAAVPVEVMNQLAQSNLDLTTAAPELGGISNINTSWMAGIMFYLPQDVDIVHGHINFADSQWALTGISQPQFWPAAHKLSNYGDGTLNGLLSIVVSDWTTPGIKAVAKRADQCLNQQEVADGVWEQMYPHLTPEVPFLPQATPEFFLDPAITFDGLGGTQNAEEFLTNEANSLQYRPAAGTGIGNLMLASDYVRTYCDIATMEGANEAGRRAANAVIDAENVLGSNAIPPPAPIQRCGVWKYPEPFVFQTAQLLDKELLNANSPFSWGSLLFP
jgi:uncharacterized protein with NAD-binding domain and iron-sulfur cluster